MSKKILSEGTIRRFMKLADIEPLSNTFIREGGMNYQRDDMAPEDEEPPMPEDELGGEEPPMPEDEPMDEPPMPEEELGMEGEMSVTDEEAQVLIDLGKKLEGASGGGEEPMPEEPELEEEPPMPEEEPAEPEEGGEELEGLDDLAELEIFDDDEIMETVYRRVAARLVKEAKRG